MDTRVYHAFEQQVEMGKKGLKVLEDWENMTAEQKAELYPHASDYAAMVDRVTKSKQYCSDCIEAAQTVVDAMDAMKNMEVEKKPKRTKKAKKAKKEEPKKDPDVFDEKPDEELDDLF